MKTLMAILSLLMLMFGLANIFMFFANGHDQGRLALGLIQVTFGGVILMCLVAIRRM